MTTKERRGVFLKQTNEIFIKKIFELRNLLFIFIALISLGCQDVKKPNQPENLISKDIMVAILTDAYISNASRSVNNFLIKKTKLKLDSMIYKKYNIDSIQFAESNAFYTSDLNTYSEIFTKVEERLVIIQNRTDSVYETLNKKKSGDKNIDSIQSISKLIDPIETSPNQDSIK